MPLRRSPRAQFHQYQPQRRKRQSWKRAWHRSRPQRR